MDFENFWILEKFSISGNIFGLLEEGWIFSKTVGLLEKCWIFGKILDFKEKMLDLIKRLEILKITSTSKHLNY